MTANWYVVAIAAAAAASIGYLAPRILAVVPEPAEPAADKRTYRELAGARALAIALAAVSLLAVLLLATRIRPAGLIVWAFFVPFGALLSYVDWHTRLLPKRLVIPGSVIVVVLSLVMAVVERDPQILVSGGISAGVVFAIFFLMWLIYPRGIGYGDVRLTGALALSLGVLGATQVIIGVYAGFVLGAVGAIVLAALRIVNARQFAFGPYLVIGAVIGAGWGPQLAALI